MFGLNKPYKSYIRLVTLCAGVAIFLSTHSSYADDSWTFKATPQSLYGSYQDSLTRRSILSYGIFVSADYLDSGNFTFGYKRADVSKAPATGDINAPNIVETSLFLSSKFSTYPDVLPGKLTFRLDGFQVEDQSTVTETVVISGGGGGMGDRIVTRKKTSTDKLNAGYAQIAFNNYAETYYIDIGYAVSTYDYNANVGLRDNEVQQLTPTFGFSLNSHYDWLQARAYIIRLQHGENTENQTSSRALELKWAHWYGPGAFLGMNSAGIKTVIGERISAVDPNAGEIYSLSDRQNYSVSLSLSWKLDERTQVNAIVGYDQYTEYLLNVSDTLTEDEYSMVYGYLNVSFEL